MALDAVLGKASVAIRAALEDLDKDLEGARSKVDSATKRMASAAGANLQAIGKITIGGIGAAIATVGGLGLALGKLAVDAAPVEGIQQAFDGLAESAGLSGDEMLAGLRRGSSGMIPARDLMLSFNKAASLVGTEFATQLPDAMQYLGKVSASTGQDMGFLMDSLVTGVGRLSPMILDNLGIQVDLAGATQRASEMFGVEAGELSKSQIQAGMMNVALEKLADNTAAMPDVSQSAAAKLAQFKTTIQDTKDRIGLAFLPTLSTLMTMFGDLAEQVLPPLTTFLENTLAPAIEGVAKFLSNFVIQLGQTEGVWEALSMAFEGTPFEDLQGTFNDVRDAITGFVDKVREVTDPIFEWISKNIELKDVLAALGIAIATVVLPALWGIVTAALPVIAGFLVLVGLVAAIRTAWENDFLGIRTTVENALAAIKQWWAEHGDEVKAKALEIWETVKTTVGEALERAKEIISNALAAIKQWWAEHGDEIMAKAKEIWDKAVEAFEFFKGQMEKLFEAFRLAFEGDWRGFGEKLREYWDAAWAKIKEIGEKVWTAIKDFFRNTDWGSVGRSILDGIAKGITAGASAIADAARNAARAALDAAKGFLGIHSPSRLAALQIGEPFALGIGKGIGDAVPALLQAAEMAGMRLMAATERMLVTSNGALPGVSREGSGGTGSTQIIIYGLTIEGVENPEGLLAQLQAMA